MVNKFQIEKELQMGGDWLGSAREWMQWNLKNGSTVQWGSHEEVRLTVREQAEFIIGMAKEIEDLKKQLAEEKSRTNMLNFGQVGK